MTGHPRYGAPDTLLLKLCIQAYQSTLAAEIGAQWGNFSPWGPVISKFRRNLCSFGGILTMQTPMQTSRAAWGAACKGGDGEGRGRTGKGAVWREEGIGNGFVCLPGACGGRYMNRDVS